MAGISLALGVAFAFFVNASQVEKIQTIVNENAQVEKDLNFAREQEKNVVQLEKERDRIRDLVAKFEERLPTSLEIPTLASQFEGLAAEEHVDVELRSLPRTTDERKEAIPYEVVARGGYHQVVSFINRLERFPRYLKVSELELGLLKDSYVAEAKFRLETYAFTSEKPVMVN